MNIYLINRNPPDTDINWDECRAMVVIAESEEDAREVAMSAHWDEGPDMWKNCYATKVGIALGSQNRGLLLQNVREK